MAGKEGRIRKGTFGQAGGPSVAVARHFGLIGADDLCKCLVVHLQSVLRQHMPDHLVKLAVVRFRQFETR